MDAWADAHDTGRLHLDQELEDRRVALIAQLENRARRRGSAEDLVLAALSVHQSRADRVRNPTTRKSRESLPREAVSLYGSVLGVRKDVPHVDLARYADRVMPAWSGRPWSRSDRAALVTFLEAEPHSALAPDVHLRLGDMWLDVHDLESAAEHYSAAIQEASSQGAAGASYLQAGLARSAWVHYLIGDAQAVQATLPELAVPVSASGPAPHRALALEAMARVVVESMDATGRSAVEVLSELATTPGADSWMDALYRSLARQLVVDAQYPEGLVVYQAAVDRDPLAWDVPVLLDEIARLQRARPRPNLPAASAALESLVTEHVPGTAWWEANESDGVAMERLMVSLREHLPSVAMGLHLEAEASGEISRFEQVAVLYGFYLEHWPLDQTADRVRWHRALALSRSGHLEQAEDELVSFLTSSSGAARDPAMWELLQVRKRRLEESFGAIEALPPDARVRARLPLSSGADRVVYELGPLHTRFIETCDDLSQADFEEGEYARALEDYRSVLRYLAGAILYRHGQLEEARQRLETVLEDGSDRTVSALAVRLILDSYQAQEDHIAHRIQSRRFGSLGLDIEPGSVGLESLFEELDRVASFRHAQLAEEDQRWVEAAERYQAFARVAVDPDRQRMALGRAASALEKGGQVLAANELLGELRASVAPARHPEMLLREALNAAAALEYAQAIEAYRMLIEQFPTHGDRSVALYNIALMHVGAGQPRQAAMALERYAKEYPRASDAESAMFLARAQWKKVGVREVEAFDKRYLRVFPREEMAHVLAIYLDRAKRAELEGSPRDADRAWRELSFRYGRAAGAPGMDPGPLARHYGALADLRNVERELAQFRQVSFTADDQSNADLLLEHKREELEELLARSTEIITDYGDFEVSSACLVLAAEAYLSYAQMLREAPVPEDFTVEMLAIYDARLEEALEPLEGRAVDRLELVLDTASSHGQWSEWQDRGSELLRLHAAESHPARTEVLGRVRPWVIPLAGPLPLDRAEAPAAQGDGVTAQAVEHLATADAEQAVVIEPAILAYLEAHPGNPAAWYDLGLCRQLQGRSAAAEVAYRQALSLDTGLSVAWQNLARLNLHGARTEAALAVVQAGHHQVPGDAALLHATLEGLLYEGEPSRAEGLARAALQHDASDLQVRAMLGRSWLAQGRLGEASALVQAALVPGTPAEGHPSIRELEGQVAWQEGRMLSGREAWIDVLDGEPLHLPTLMQLAHSYLAVGDAAQARNMLERAREAYPEVPEVSLALGVAYARLERPEEAMEAYLRALRLNPWSTDPLWNLAILQQDHVRNPESTVLAWDTYLQRGGPMRVEAEQYREEAR
ncbi:MAG: tetratricopeptide repeat protein, partial [Myxococcota bacterium]|nr:tetratricopeptide repeat protein [Myxococcota bacterium]